MLTLIVGGPAQPAEAREKSQDERNQNLLPTGPVRVVVAPGLFGERSSPARPHRHSDEMVTAAIVVGTATKMNSLQRNCGRENPEAIVMTEVCACDRSPTIRKSRNATRGNEALSAIHTVIARHQSLLEGCLDLCRKRFIVGHADFGSADDQRGIYESVRSL